MRKKRKLKYNKKRNILKSSIAVILVIYIVIFATYYKDDIDNLINNLSGSIKEKPISYNIEQIPEYTGESYITINNNEPFFEESELTKEPFEEYSNLDNLGRCGVAFALISIDTMPTEERSSIGQIKPSGWHTIKYDIVDAKYLYNRCHLIGYQLTGENANEKNLITCTRFMNTVGMLQFENKVAEYVKETNNHVLYRVTPIFEGTNLLASGVEIEALSIEDNGIGIKFNVYVYNVQEGITIDYSNGDSSLNK